jgi:hypothetical protein
MAGTSHANWSGFRVHDPIWKVAAVSSPEQQRPGIGFMGLGDQGAPHPELPLPRTLAEET